MSLDQQEMQEESNYNIGVNIDQEVEIEEITYLDTVQSVNIDLDQEIPRFEAFVEGQKVILEGEEMDNIVEKYSFYSGN